MDSPIGPPRFKGLKITLVAGLALLTTDALFAQSDGQSDVDALKSQMNQMQRQYEQRIEAMEAKMKALESGGSGTSGSILNTRVLTDADGKAVAPTPMLDESFLKSLTRNFSLAVYMRAGVSFNGSGGAQGNITFIMPDNYIGGGRTTSRLGNEQDFYTEIAWNQAHILGDSPDVIDASWTGQIQAFSNPIKASAINVSAPGTGTNGFGIGINQAFVEMKNVIKSAPEITFWAGDRFYDRWNIDSEDYFWLNTSGFGIGVYNIHFGDCPGTLWLAWLGNNNDNINEATTISTFNAVNSRVGDLYKQTWDVRYKDIPFLCGKLSLVAIGNYIKGDTYESTFTAFGGTAQGVTFGQNVTGIIQTHDMYGIGGGAIWEYDFGNKSMLRLSALYGVGATDFQGNIGNQISQLNNAWQNDFNRFLISGSDHNVQFRRGSNGLEPFIRVNPVDQASEALATAYFVWNPNPCFSLGVWANWEYNDNGTAAVGLRTGTTITRNGNVVNGKIVQTGGSRNIVSGGIRPVVWLTDSIAIQGVASGAYIDNVRVQTGDAFGNHGTYGIFTIAPTIKPKGGFFTRPEIRLFATYAIWSDSLKGSSIGGSVPYTQRNVNQGWLFGSQMEIWF
jgi:maltoporin